MTELIHSTSAPSRPLVMRLTCTGVVRDEDMLTLTLRCRHTGRKTNYRLSTYDPLFRKMVISTGMPGDFVELSQLIKMNLKLQICPADGAIVDVENYQLSTQCLRPLNGGYHLERYGVSHPWIASGDCLRAAADAVGCESYPLERGEVPESVIPPLSEVCPEALELLHRKPQFVDFTASRPQLLARKVASLFGHTYTHPILD